MDQYDLESDEDNIIVEKEIVAPKFTSIEMSSDIVNASEMESERILTDLISTKAIQYTKDDGSGWVAYLDESSPRDDETLVYKKGKLIFERLGDNFAYMTKEIKGIYKFSLSKKFSTGLITFQTNGVMKMKKNFLQIGTIKTKYEVYVDEEKVDHSIVFENIVLPNKEYVYVNHSFFVPILNKSNKNSVIISILRTTDNNYKVYDNNVTVMVNINRMKIIKK